MAEYTSCMIFAPHNFETDTMHSVRRCTGRRCRRHRRRHRRRRRVERLCLPYLTHSCACDGAAAKLTNDDDDRETTVLSRTATCSRRCCSCVTSKTSRRGPWYAPVSRGSSGPRPRVLYVDSQWATFTARVRVCHDDRGPHVHVMWVRRDRRSVPSGGSSSRPTSASPTSSRRSSRSAPADALKPEALAGALRSSRVAVADSTEASVPPRPCISSLDAKSGQTVGSSGSTRRVSEAPAKSPGSTRRVSEAQVKCPVVTEILDSRTQNILKVTHCSYQVVV